jgi:hypothetical protein
MGFVKLTVHDLRTALQYHHADTELELRGPIDKNKILLVTSYGELIFTFTKEIKRKTKRKTIK